VKIIDHSVQERPGEFSSRAGRVRPSRMPEGMRPEQHRLGLL
jgi:hypothetical protein